MEVAFMSMDLHNYLDLVRVEVLSELISFVILMLQADLFAKASFVDRVLFTFISKQQVSEDQIVIFSQVILVSLVFSSQPLNLHISWLIILYEVCLELAIFESAFTRKIVVVH